MNSRGSEIEPAAQGTREWLLRHPNYISWISQPPGLLWIKGKPGAGKSTLMKFTLDALDPSELRSRTIFTVSFFFHGRGAEIQKTPEGLFKSLLHQLLQRFPKSLSNAVQIFKSRYSSMGKHGEKWNWASKGATRLTWILCPQGSWRLCVSNVCWCAWWRW